MQCATVSMQYDHNQRRFLRAQHGVLEAPQLKPSYIPFGMEIITVSRVWHLSDIKVFSASASHMWMIRVPGLSLEGRWPTDCSLAPGVSFQSYKGAFRRRIEHVDDSPSGLASGREMVDTVSLWHVTYVMTSCSLALVTATCASRRSSSRC